MKEETKSRFKVDWIVIDQLAIGSLPRKALHLEMLKKENIKCIFGLCENNDYTKIDNFKEFFTYEQFILPDHKVGKLPSINQIENCLNILENLLKKGKTYVHCYAAMERSPLICMAWLIRKHNLNPQESLDYVMQTHKGTSPLPGQLLLLDKIHNQNI